MSPTEIGHAAAYEAYRTWMHNRSMYEPLGPDMERQREGLIGLAVAECASHLSAWFLVLTSDCSEQVAELCRPIHGLLR